MYEEFIIRLGSLNSSLFNRIDLINLWQNIYTILMIPQLRCPILYTRFFSRSPYFRGFRGWPSARENNMIAKSANWSKLRKARLSIALRTETLQYQMGNMYTIHTLPVCTWEAVCIQYFIVKICVSITQTKYWTSMLFIKTYFDSKYSS